MAPDSIFTPTLAGIVKAEYRDRDGIRRRVLIPATGGDPSEGIPISVPVDRLFSHCPVEWRRSLIDELWARGLVEAADFKRAGANELIQGALRSLIKHDTLSIIDFVKGDKP